jgi:hypothetical protein
MLGFSRQLYMARVCFFTFEMVKMLKSYMEKIPFLRAHCCAKNTLVEAFKDSPYIHVVHYDIMYGIQ